MSTVLGATWHPMMNVYDLDKLDGRTGEKAYGVRALSGAENNESNVLGRYTLDHSFEMLLSRTCPGKRDDEELTDAIEGMYNSMDEIYRDIVVTKLGLSSAVLLVTGLSLLEPEILKGGQMAVLRAQFQVRYFGNV